MYIYIYTHTYIIHICKYTEREREIHRLLEQAQGLEAGVVREKGLRRLYYAMLCYAILYYTIPYYTIRLHGLADALPHRDEGAAEAGHELPVVLNNNNNNNTYIYIYIYIYIYTHI